jgi:hypothetical protein
MAPRPRAHAASKSILHVRLTDRERGALRRAATARGCKDYDLVRAWIEAADAGVLQPAPPASCPEEPGADLSLHAAALLYCGPGARWRIDDVVRDVAACGQLDDLLTQAHNYKSGVDWTPAPPAPPPRLEPGLSVDGSLPGRTRWLVDLVDQLASQIDELRKPPARLLSALRSVRHAAEDVRELLAGVEPAPGQGAAGDA